MINILNCQTPEIASIISILKNISNIIMIITPILAIIYITINLVKATINPEDKKIPQHFKNIILSLVIIFMIPTIINTVMYILDEKTDFSSCWKNVNYKLQPTSAYQEPITNLPKKSLLQNEKDYEKGEERKNNTPSNNGIVSNSTSLQNLFNAAKQADQHTYNNKYHYGNALSWDGTNMKDKSGNTVSCDRGVGLTLYYAGLTKTDPNKLSLGVLSNELGNKGWKKITNYNELQPGDIVFYDRDHNGSLEHTFLIGEKINKRYDWGSNDRIKHRGPYSSGMPFTEGISSSAFYYAYRMP